MAGRDMMLQVVVRLRDQLSQGLNGILGRIRAWGASANRIFASVGRGIGNLMSSVSLLGVGIAAGLMSGLRSFTELDDIARQTAVNLRKYGADAEGFIKGSHAWAQGLTKATGQTSRDILAAQNRLIGAGLSEGVANTMVPQIATTATAASAELADMTETSTVLFQAWDIGATRMGVALGMLFEAGRQGNFELKAMAKSLPNIAPLAAAIGSKGERAIGVSGALLQVSKMGAGSDEEAANNYRNFLSQITGPAFAERMAKEKVDVGAVLKDAAIKGIDPIEAILQKVIKVTGAEGEARKAATEAAKKGLAPGDTAKLVQERVLTALQGSKLGKILPDMQAKTFVASFLARRAEYLRIRDAIMNTDPAEQSKAFDTMMAGPKARERMAAEDTEQVVRRLGSSLTGLADAASWAATKFKGVIDELDSISPKIVDIATQLALVASAIGGVWATLRLLGGGGAAAAAAGAAAGAAAPVVGGAAAGAAGGWFSRLFGGAGSAATGAAAAGTEAAAGATAGIASRLGLMARAAGRIAWPIAAGVTAYDAMEWMKTNKAGPWDERPNPNIQRYGATDRFGKPVRPKPTGPQSSAPAEVKVGGSITVKVDGPGQVTGVSSTNPAVPITTDRGANGGRP